MPKNVQDSDSNTQTQNDGLVNDGDGDTKRSTVELDDDKRTKKEKLEDPDVKSEIDRRVAAAVLKRDADNALKAEEAAKKARKEAAEAKLLEDGKLEELANMKTKEAEEYKEKLAKYERDIKVDALLDKKEILNPEMRALFKMSGNDIDLTKLNDVIDGFNKVFDDMVSKKVDERLLTGTPSTKQGTTLRDSQDLDVRIHEAESKGDWALSHKLKNEKLADMHKAKLGTRVSIPESTGGTNPVKIEIPTGT